MLQPRKQLLNLGLSDSEVTVYLAMISGLKTAREIVKMTGLKRPTVYYALGCLEKRSLINKSQIEGDKKFNLQPVDRLKVIAEEKLLEINKVKQNIQDLVPFLQSKASSETSENQHSTVTFFEGTEAIKRVIIDMLYCRNRSINSIAPHDNFLKQVGQGFRKLFVEERKRLRIKTRNLWEETVDESILKKYYPELSEIRILPDFLKGKFKTSIFLYDDQVLYVSSLKNNYCLLISSKENHDTMQALFDGLWSTSRVLK